MSEKILFINEISDLSKISGETQIVKFNVDVEGTENIPDLVNKIGRTITGKVWTIRNDITVNLMGHTLTNVYVTVDGKAKVVFKNGTVRKNSCLPIFYVKNGSLQVKNVDNEDIGTTATEGNIFFVCNIGSGFDSMANCYVDKSCQFHTSVLDIPEKDPTHWTELTSDEYNTYRNRYKACIYIRGEWFSGCPYVKWNTASWTYQDIEKLLEGKTPSFFCDGKFTVQSSGDTSCWLYTNGSGNKFGTFVYMNENSNVVVNGTGAGIHKVDAGGLVLNGGYLYAPSAVIWRASKVYAPKDSTIKIEGYGPYKPYINTSSGQNLSQLTLGHAMFFENRPSGYGGYSGKYREPTISLNGGTYISHNNYAIGSYSVLEGTTRFPRAVKFTSTDCTLVSGKESTGQPYVVETGENSDYDIMK